ncbi:MAG TPA: transposase [Candidatus Saccharimonadales bacterium]|nr:transposase [Candidatus Saccharimonadales bacterium]
MARRRLLCKACSNPLILWGKTSGKKRYRCLVCKTTRTYHGKEKSSEAVLGKLFTQYVLWGVTYEMISSLSGYSVAHLIETFHGYFLSKPPALPLLDQSVFVETFLLLDGLWLKRGFVLMAYRQSGNLQILHISVVGREAATKIAKDLRVLKGIYRFTGVVSDGGTGIVKAVGDVFPHIPHQICLAHLHRDVIAAIGRYPKSEQGRELKHIADHVWLIESKEALQWWQKEVKQWKGRYNEYLKEKRYDLSYNWWYIHKGVRRAVHILEGLPETSFKFLDHPIMPKTTNELEAQFGHLGKRWLTHRGLKTERWESFMRWFVYFYNREKLSQKKMKEDGKNNRKY